MTTETQAFSAIGCLAGSITGYTDDQVMHFANEFQKRTDDGEVLIEVCEQIGATWTDMRNRPTLGVVLDEYRRHPTVVAEREERVARDLARRGSVTTCGGSGWLPTVSSGEAMKPCHRCNPFLAYIWPDEKKRDAWLNGRSIADLHDDLSTNRSGVTAAEYPMPAPCRSTERPDPGEAPSRLVSVAEGLAIANSEHHAMFGRDIGESFKPVGPYAESVIERVGTFDPNADVWRAKYGDVAEVFRYDHARCRASIMAIGSRRVAMDDRGNIVMRPEAPPESPGGQWVGPGPSAPVPAPDRGVGVDPDAAASIGAAIADTVRRLT